MQINMRQFFDNFCTPCNDKFIVKKFCDEFRKTFFFSFVFLYFDVGQLEITSAVASLVWLKTTVLKVDGSNPQDSTQHIKYIRIV